MKCRKLISMLLALIMMMALVVPAGAAKPAKNKGNTPAAQAIPVDKIESDDPRKPIVESGAEIDTAGYPAIYIKQANDIAIIVPAGDKRTDADIIAEAAASDNSLNKQDKGTTTVIRGNGSVWLHKNKTTLVTVEDGILTVVGPISHIDFGGGKPAPEFPTEPEDPDDGKVSAVFQITKYLNEYGAAGEGFVFDIIPVVDGVEGESVGSMTSDANGEAKITLDVAPGKYIIREQVDADEYMPVSDVYVTVDENGKATFNDTTFDGTITNVQWGKLEYTTPEVTEKYNEIWHKMLYAENEAPSTLVSLINAANGANLDTDVVLDKGAKGNGFTWLKIDKSALETKGLTIGIADSSKQDKATSITNWNIPASEVAPEKPWEDGVAPYYNLQIVDGKLVVSSNLKNFAAGVYASEDAIVTAPGQIGENPKGHIGDAKEKTIDLSAMGDQFYFILHVANEGNFKYLDANKPIGCNGEKENLISRECKRPYTGTVTVTVQNTAGEEVTNFDKMAPGEYTVTVTANGQTLDTQTVTVSPGETTTVTFPNDLTVQGADEYHCANPDCDLNKSSAEG